MDAMAFPGTPARKLLLGGSATARALGFDPHGAGEFFLGLWLLVKEKAAEVAAYLATLLAALARKADELFPPETLRLWLHVAVTVLLPAALGLLVLYWIARCCCRCCCCCARAAARCRGTVRLLAAKTDRNRALKKTRYP
ncbi:hypothetical protein EJB05_11393, partial [Eragrostis curvula]